MTPLTEVVEGILQERGPLKPVEPAMAIRESGYRTDADPRTVMAAVRQLLRRYPKTFRRGVDGRWTVEHVHRSA